MATGYFSHPDCLAHDMGTQAPRVPPAHDEPLRTNCGAQGLDALMQHGEVPLVAAVVRPGLGPRPQLRPDLG
jgi:hypothetical protein